MCVCVPSAHALKIIRRRPWLQETVCKKLFNCKKLQRWLLSTGYLNLAGLSRAWSRVANTMTLVVTILSDQSVIFSVFTSHFSIGTVRLEPQQRWYHLKRAEASRTVPYHAVEMRHKWAEPNRAVPYHAVEKRQSVPYRTEPYRTMQWKSAIMFRTNVIALQ